MTAFTTLLNALFIPGKPILGSTGSALRDNALAIAEADSSVALGLLPSVLLGTLTTTSGTTQTLSGLNLTPYRFLRMTVNGVSFTGTVALRLNAISITAVLGTAGFSFYGTVFLDLSSGIATAIIAESNAGASTAGAVRAPVTSYSNATTSISFDGGTFDAGSIRVYGEK